MHGDVSDTVINQNGIAQHEEGCGDTGYDDIHNPCELEWDSFADGGYDSLCHDDVLDEFQWLDIDLLEPPMQLSYGVEIKRSKIEPLRQNGSSNSSSSLEHPYKIAYCDDVDDYQSCSSTDYFSCSSRGSDTRLDKVKDLKYDPNEAETKRVHLQFSSVTVNIDITVSQRNNKTEYQLTADKIRNLPQTEEKRRECEKWLEQQSENDFGSFGDNEVNTKTKPFTRKERGKICLKGSEEYSFNSMIPIPYSMWKDYDRESSSSTSASALSSPSSELLDIPAISYQSNSKEAYLLTSITPSSSYENATPVTADDVKLSPYVEDDSEYIEDVPWEAYEELRRNQRSPKRLEDKKCDKQTENVTNITNGGKKKQKRETIDNKKWNETERKDKESIANDLTYGDDIGHIDTENRSIELRGSTFGCEQLENQFSWLTIYKSDRDLSIKEPTCSDFYETVNGIKTSDESEKPIQNNFKDSESSSEKEEPFYSRFFGKVYNFFVGSELEQEQTSSNNLRKDKDVDECFVTSALVKKQENIKTANSRYFAMTREFVKNIIYMSEREVLKEYSRIKKRNEGIGKERNSKEGNISEKSSNIVDRKKQKCIKDESKSFFTKLVDDSHLLYLGNITSESESSSDSAEYASKTVEFTINQKEKPRVSYYIDELEKTKQKVSLRPRSSAKPISTSQKQRGKTAKQSSASAKPNMASPISNCGSSKQTNVSPRSSQRSTSTSPKPNSASPKQTSTSPKSTVVSTISTRASQKQTSTSSPSFKNASAKPASASPKESSALPKPNIGSPKHINTSPRSNVTSPKQSSTTPKHINTSPRSSGTSQKQPSKSPRSTVTSSKHISASPRPTSVYTRSTGVSPRSVKPASISVKPTSISSNSEETWYKHDGAHKRKSHEQACLNKTSGINKQAYFNTNLGQLSKAIANYTVTRCENQMILKYWRLQNRLAGKRKTANTIPKEKSTRPTKALNQRKRCLQTKAVSALLKQVAVKAKKELMMEYWRMWNQRYGNKDRKRENSHQAITCETKHVKATRTRTGRHLKSEKQIVSGVKKNRTASSAYKSNVSENKKVDVGLKGHINRNTSIHDRTKPFDKRSLFLVEISKAMANYTVSRCENDMILEYWRLRNRLTARKNCKSNKMDREKIDHHQIKRSRTVGPKERILQSEPIRNLLKQVTVKARKELMLEFWRHWNLKHARSSYKKTTSSTNDDKSSTCKENLRTSSRNDENVGKPIAFKFEKGKTADEQLSSKKSKLPKPSSTGDSRSHIIATKGLSSWAVYQGGKEITFEYWRRWNKLQLQRISKLPVRKSVRKRKDSNAMMCISIKRLVGFVIHQSMKECILKYWQNWNKTRAYQNRCKKSRIPIRKDKMRNRTTGNNLSNKTDKTTSYVETLSLKQLANSVVKQSINAARKIMAQQYLQKQYSKEKKVHEKHVHFRSCGEKAIFSNGTSPSSKTNIEIKFDEENTKASKIKKYPMTHYHKNVNSGLDQSARKQRLVGKPSIPTKEGTKKQLYPEKKDDKPARELNPARELKPARELNPAREQYAYRNTAKMSPIKRNPIVETRVIKTTTTTRKYSPGIGDMPKQPCVPETSAIGTRERVNSKGIRASIPGTYKLPARTQRSVITTIKLPNSGTREHRYKYSAPQATRKFTGNSTF